jgi:hypothetical protein
MTDFRIVEDSNDSEVRNRAAFVELFKGAPIPDAELLNNLGLFISRQNLSRMLFVHDLYTKILDVHGIVMEFGVRWGQNLALFAALRGMYEPFNYSRTIVGFDTFGGFPDVHAKDGGHVAEGDYAVGPGYESYLEEVLRYHESESPIAHKKKFELVKGDATQTIDTYLNRHPETIVALAFDLYTPTKKCLEAIRGRVTKGSVLAFDELNTPQFPGETLAVMEVLGLDRYAIKRSPLNPLCSYLVIA